MEHIALGLNIKILDIKPDSRNPSHTWTCLIYSGPPKCSKKSKQCLYPLRSFLSLFLFFARHTGTVDIFLLINLEELNEIDQILASALGTAYLACWIWRLHFMDMTNYSEWGSGACFVSLVHACFFLTPSDSSFMKPEFQPWAWSLCTFWLQQWSNNPLGVIVIEALVLNQNPENPFTWLMKSGFSTQGKQLWSLSSLCLFPLSECQTLVQTLEPSVIQNTFLGNELMLVICNLFFR